LYSKSSSVEDVLSIAASSDGAAIETSAGRIDSSAATDIDGSVGTMQDKKTTVEHMELRIRFFIRLPYLSEIRLHS
jgi:hypothetical protein